MQRTIPKDQQSRKISYPDESFQNVIITQWEEDEISNEKGQAVRVRASFKLGAIEIKRTLFFPMDRLWSLEHWYIAAGLKPTESEYGKVYQTDEMIGKTIKAFIYKDTSGYLTIGKTPPYADEKLEDYKKRNQWWLNRERPQKQEEDEAGEPLPL